MFFPAQTSVGRAKAPHSNNVDRIEAEWEESEMEEYNKIEHREVEDGWTQIRVEKDSERQYIYIYRERERERKRRTANFAMLVNAETERP